jgi:hypothetical protein
VKSDTRFNNNKKSLQTRNLKQKPEDVRQQRIGDIKKREECVDGGERDDMRDSKRPRVRKKNKLSKITLPIEDRQWFSILLREVERIPFKMPKKKKRKVGVLDPHPVDRIDKSSLRLLLSGVRPLASRGRSTAFRLSSFQRLRKINGPLLSSYDKFVSHNLS